MEYTRQPNSTRVITVVTAATVAASLPGFLTGGLAVQIGHSLSLTDAQTGIMLALYFGVLTIASAPVGFLAQRIGLDRSAALAVGLGAVALLVIGSAAVWAQTLVGLALAGVAGALVLPVGSGLLVRDVDESRRALAFGVRQSAMPAASLIGGLAVPLIALTAGWRWAYFLPALLSLGLAFAMARSARERSQTMGREPRAARPRLHYRPILVLGAGAGFGAASASALITFATSSAVAIGIPDAFAGLLLALGGIVGISMRLVSSGLARRGNDAPLAIVAVMLVGGAVGYGLMGTSTVVLFVPGLLLAFGLGWAWPALFHYTIAQRHGSNTPVVAGIANTCTFLGATLGPLGFAAVAGASSMSLAWLAAALSAVAGASVLAAAHWSHQRAIAPPQLGLSTTRA